MLKHQNQIDAFYAWRATQATRKREKQLEDDSIQVFDYTSEKFSEDTNSELKFKE